MWPLHRWPPLPTPVPAILPMQYAGVDQQTTALCSYPAGDNCHTADVFNNGGMPPASCGTSVYVLSMPTFFPNDDDDGPHFPPQTLTRIDAKTGSVAATNTLGKTIPTPAITAVACGKV